MATSKPNTIYTVKRAGPDWYAWRGEEMIGRRPKYKQAQRICEASAGQSLEWTRSSEGYRAVR